MTTSRTTAKTLRIQTPRAFKPLLQPSRYKAAHGGRGSGKSHFFAELLIEKCLRQKTDWVCLREVQLTLDQSVKKLLEEKIYKFGVQDYFGIQNTRIKTPYGGNIIFRGMQDQTSESIKSLEGYDGALFEEAQMMSAKSLELLRPTIRNPNSELWFPWNPRHPTDPIDQFFRGGNPPPDSIIIEVNYYDNPWFPDVLEQERLFDLSVSPERHAHVWGGAYIQDGDNQLIPAAWVQAAINAHIALGIEKSGIKKAALDVADEGIDKNSLCIRQGIVVEHIEEWTGQGADIFRTVERSFGLCDEHRLTTFDYDSDGLGAGVRGDARVINERRETNGQNKINVNPFRGSSAVAQPEREMVQGRKNKDFFANRKAQAWWELRLRFLKTFRAINQGMEFDPDQIISIPKNPKLIQELSQPTFSINGAGKVMIDKAPDGAKSPNLADSVMICFTIENTNAGILDFYSEKSKLLKIQEADNGKNR